MVVLKKILKMQVNRPARRKDNGNKEQRKTEKQMMEKTGKRRTPQFSS